MRNVDYYKTPRELAAAFISFCKSHNRCVSCQQFAQTVQETSVTCQLRFSYAEHIEATLPIPKYLRDPKTHLVGKNTSRLYDIVALSSTPTNYGLAVKCHYGSDETIILENFESLDHLKTIYDIITLEKVPT